MAGKQGKKKKWRKLKTPMNSGPWDPGKSTANSRVSHQSEQTEPARPTVEKDARRSMGRVESSKKNGAMDSHSQETNGPRCGLEKSRWPRPTLRTPSPKAKNKSSPSFNMSTPERDLSSRCSPDHTPTQPSAPPLKPTRAGDTTPPKCGRRKEFGYVKSLIDRRMTWGPKQCVDESAPGDTNKAEQPPASAKPTSRASVIGLRPPTTTTQATTTATATTATTPTKNNRLPNRQTWAPAPKKTEPKPTPSFEQSQDAANNPRPHAPKPDNADPDLTPADYSATALIWTSAVSQLAVRPDMLAALDHAVDLDLEDFCPADGNNNNKPVATAAKLDKILSQLGSLVGAATGSYALSVGRWRRHARLPAPLNDAQASEAWEQSLEGKWEAQTLFLADYDEFMDRVTEGVAWLVVAGGGELVGWRGGGEEPPPAVPTPWAGLGRVVGDLLEGGVVRDLPGCGGVEVPLGLLALRSARAWQRQLVADAEEAVMMWGGVAKGADDGRMPTVGELKFFLEGVVGALTLIAKAVLGARVIRNKEV